MGRQGLVLSDGKPSGQLLHRLLLVFPLQKLVFQRQTAHMKEMLSYGRLVARASPDDRMPIRLRFLHMKQG